jgi:hypothetical protein
VIGEPGNFETFSSCCATWYTAENGGYAASIWGLTFYDKLHIGCITIAKSKQGEINPHDPEQF